MATDEGRVDVCVRWIDIASRYRLTPCQCGDILAGWLRRYE